jgi:hypothetical protein
MTDPPSSQDAPASILDNYRNAGRDAAADTPHGLQEYHPMTNGGALAGREMVENTGYFGGNAALTPRSGHKHEP